MRKSDSQAALLATAYHEAGHMAVAFHLGIRIAKKGVTIAPAGDYSGRAHFLHNLHGLDVTVSDAMRIKAERFAIMSLAGAESQRMHRPTSIRSHQSRGDYDDAVDIMSYFAVPNEMDLYMRLLQQRARNIVRSRPVWTMIQGLALVLMEKRTLSGDEAVAVMKTAIQDAMHERSTARTDHRTRSSKRKI